MLIEINKGDSAEDIKRKMAALRRAIKKSRKYPDYRKYFGTVSVNEDQIQYQKRMRDEWR